MYDSSSFRPAADERARPNWGATNTDANSNSPGQAKGAQQRGGGKAQIALRPMTIRMLVEAQRVGDGAMLVSGAEVGGATILGRVVEATTDTNTGTAKNFNYKITDGTGVLSVRHFVDSAQNPTLEEVGSYVSASGNVKIFQDKPQLTGTVRVVGDQNELTFHLLDCINVHQRLTIGDKKPAAPPGEGPATQQPISAPAAGAGHAGGGVAAAAGMDELIPKIYNILAPGTPLSADEIFQCVQSMRVSCTMPSIQMALTSMVDQSYCRMEGGKYRV